MTASISARLQSAITVIETFSGADASNDTATFDDLNEDTTLTGSTSPAATKFALFDQAMSGGAATIDLTALPGVTADETVNGNGLKVQFLKLTNKSTNANKITVSQGASTAYRLDGATSWSVVLAPGQSALFELNNASETISSSHKDIDLAGTLAQVLRVHVVMG